MECRTESVRRRRHRPVQEDLVVLTPAVNDHPSALEDDLAAVADDMRGEDDARRDRADPDMEERALPAGQRCLACTSKPAPKAPSDPR